MIAGIFTGFAIALLVLVIAKWVAILAYYVLKGILTVAINLTWKVMDGLLNAFWRVCDETEELIDRCKKKIVSAIY